MRTVIMNPQEISLCIKRMACEIAEGTKDASRIGLIGIRSGGIPVMDRLSAALTEMQVAHEVGFLDVTVYRDDLIISDKIPEVKSSAVPFDVNGCCVVLVDDVLFTGRTLHAGLNAVMEYGRPSFVKAAVLIDRGHRELPISANYIGKRVDTFYNETVDVLLSEGGNDSVILVKD